MMKKIYFIALISIVFSTVLLSACASMGGGRTSAEPKVSMYIRTWPIPEAARQDGNLYWNAGMVKAEYLTDLIISFALLDPNDVSQFYIPELRPLPDGGPLFDNIWDEVAALKAAHPHLKVNLSVGGYGADGFSDMALDPALRAAFIANVCTWLEQYNLDGMDVDWEYPVGPDWDIGIKVRPQDKQNYIALLREMRAAMDQLGEKTGKRYGLSTAVPASNWFPKANDVVAAARIVDSLKLMSYDYYGGWSRTTGHNANLKINTLDPAWGGWSTDQALIEYLAAGVPPAKISLGFAFYGKAWKGVPVGNNDSTPGLFQPYESLPWDQGSVGWLQIAELLKPGSGYTRYWDEYAQAPYLYNGDIWISYTDEEQIKLLTKYAKEHRLGGVFVWEYGHDINAELLKILAENAQ